MDKYINLRTDFGFKYIFGREDILIDFINVVLRSEPGYEPIVKIELNDKEMKKHQRELRGIIYDILCTTDSGRKFIVEMQHESQKYFIDRSLYYVARCIVDQGVQGREWRYGFKPVYIISLLDFTLDMLGPRLRSDAMLCDLDTHQPITDKMRFIYIQLPNLAAKSWEDCRSDFELLVYLIKNLETMEMIPFARPGSIFEKIQTYAEYAALSDSDRHEYDINLQGYRDYMSTIEHANEKGRAEGRAETKIEMARSMRKIGMSAIDIRRVTGLSPDEY